nr:hypothetical protein CFP56_55878 [Quercus suber]
MKHSLRASCGSTVADGGGEKNGMEGIVVGKVGSKGGKGVGLGKVGTTGTVGTEGVVVCKRLRAAKLRLMLDNMLKTTKKAKMNHLLDAMMEKEIVFLKVLKWES